MADIAKVKRNIQRMIDQNAPESDIDAYVASEGTTPEELRGATSFDPASVALPNVPIGAQEEQALPWYTPITSAPGNALDLGKALASGAMEQAKAAFEPIDTPMGRMPLGPVAGPLYKNFTDIAGIAKPVIQDTQGTYDAAKQGLDQNLGTPTRAWNTIATHPVDTLLFLAPGVGQLGKAAQASGMVRTGQALSRAGAAMDPINLLSKPVEKFTAARNAKTYQKGLLDSAPSQDDVAANANSMWDSIRSENIQFPADTYRPFSAEIRKSFDTIGSEAAPQVSALRKSLMGKLGPMPVPEPIFVGRKKMQQPPQPDTRTVPFNDIEEIRRTASEMSVDQSISQTDRKVAGDLARSIEKYYETQPGLNEKLGPAKEMSRRNILAREIEGMKDKSKWYLAGEESGIKNKVASFGKKKGQSLTKAEEAAFKNVVKKEGINSILSTIGGRLGQLVLGGVGASLGGVPGLLGAGGAHFAARSLSERATLRALDKAKKTVLLGKEKQLLLDKKPMGRALNKNLVRGLLGSQAVLHETPTK